VGLQSQQQAFNDLKQRLCSTPVLSLPDLQHPFDIETDASDYDVGTILTQHGHPVAYHSETLLDVVRKYPTYDKEMYSIVQASASGHITFLGRRQSSTLIISHCSSCKHRENCRMTAIKSGPHNCCNSTSTSSIKQEAPIASLIASADRQS
jgi:hypothetical protein